MSRAMTEFDYKHLLALRDMAVALDSQIDAICDMVRELVPESDDDDRMDLIKNGGDIKDFLKNTDIVLVANRLKASKK
jgi:hypothetical protein